MEEYRGVTFWSVSFSTTVLARSSLVLDPSLESFTSRTVESTAGSIWICRAGDTRFLSMLVVSDRHIN